VDPVTCVLSFFLKMITLANSIGDFVDLSKTFPVIVPLIDEEPLWLNAKVVKRIVNIKTVNIFFIIKFMKTINIS
jgi:hypothetical protein